MLAARWGGTAPDAQKTGCQRRMPRRSSALPPVRPGSLLPTWQRNISKKQDESSASMWWSKSKGQTVLRGTSPRNSCRRAKACIFAAEVAIKKSAGVFRESTKISVPVRNQLRHAEALGERDERWRYSLYPMNRVRTSRHGAAKKCVKTELKQALLSEITFAVPLIVAGGTVQAVSVLLASEILGLQHLFDQENSWRCGCTANWAAGCSVF